MPKREFLMLAHKFQMEKVNFCNWYASEKLDGVRCYWDGGISTGMLCTQVPWANTVKHGRFLSAPVATGLWTRYGQPIQAPQWFIDSLPPFSLDGELYCGVKQWQKLVSAVKKMTPVDSEWRDVRYMVFDSPPYEDIFEDGYINTTNYKRQLKGAVSWCKGRCEQLGTGQVTRKYFYERLGELRRYDFKPPIMLLEQTQLPAMRPQAIEALNSLLQKVVDSGGEGVMLRDPVSLWNPCRAHGLLKVKPYQDAEGTVVGYKFAKGTDLERSITGQATNKLLGLMGSVTVLFDDKRFDLSGFTEEERKLTTEVGDSDAAFAHAVSNPGEEAPAWITNPKFPRGTRITFRYRELSDEGLPKEARYHRVHEDV